MKNANLNSQWVICFGLLTSLSFAPTASAAPAATLASRQITLQVKRIGKYQNYDSQYVVQGLMSGETASFYNTPDCKDLFGAKFSVKASNPTHSGSLIPGRRWQWLDQNDVTAEIKTSNGKSLGCFKVGLLGPQPLAAVHVKAGRSHTCAILENSSHDAARGGQVRCWGRGELGQLGDGLRETSSNPRLVTGLNDAVELALGLDHSCALRANGQVACWGDGWSGQLGIGHRLGSAVPATVLGIQGVTQLAAGSDHSCAVLNHGGVSCWGDNRFGQVGVANQTRSVVPVSVPGLSNVIDISLGGRHSCAPLINGAVACWGADESSQLVGTINEEMLSGEVEDFAKVLQVAAGSHFTCMLYSNHEVACQGSNERGQLGLSFETDMEHTPVRLENLIKPVQIATGDQHGCALLADGHLFCWGNQNDGRRGNGVSYKLPDSPTRVVDLDSVTQFSLGHSHTCAVQKDHRVYCWGAAEDGQIGRVTKEGLDYPRYVTLSEFGPVSELDLRND